MIDFKSQQLTNILLIIVIVLLIVGFYSLNFKLSAVYNWTGYLFGNAH